MGRGYSGDGGPSVDAVYNYTIGVEFDNLGNLFVDDLFNNRIRKIDAGTKIITTIAGNGIAGFSGDGGQADQASLSDPEGIAVDNAGNIFIADNHNLRVRRIDAGTHIITTIAGNGNAGVAGRGGLAVNAELASVIKVAIDKNGNLYLNDWFGSTIEKVDAATGIITTIVGQSYNWGFSGDGGPATSAILHYPYSVDVDDNGNIYIADNWNNRIRRVDGVTKIITTIAGNGVSSSTGDGGLATSATISAPWTVKWDHLHSLYITESNRIRKIDLNTNMITAVAGTGVSGYSGDGGPPQLAELANPVGITFDGSGSVYIGDYANSVIREIVPSNILPTKLLSFTGSTVKNNETLLKWSTAVEEGTSFFEVQYSSDGNQFSSIFTMKAKGESSSYEYLHCCPDIGNAYYRLKMIDQDGKFSSSKIIALRVESDETQIKIFPNPASDQITIKYPVTTKDEVFKIINMQGNVFRILQIPKGSCEILVSLKEIGRGTYFIRSTNNNLNTVEFLLH